MTYALLILALVLACIHIHAKVETNPNHSKAKGVKHGPKHTAQPRAHAIHAKNDNKKDKNDNKNDNKNEISKPEKCVALDPSLVRFLTTHKQEPAAHFPHCSTMEGIKRKMAHALATSTGFVMGKVTYTYIPYITYNIQHT
jgi:hypothetical protein